ncbi:MAG: hypothetical protein ABWK53_12240 [Anaerolineales bacterium]
MKTAQEYYQEFLRLKAMPVPKRGHGIRYTRIVFWMLNAFVLACVGLFFLVLRFPILVEVRIFGYLISALMFTGIFVFPELFYDDHQLRKRYVKRKHPQLNRSMLRLRVNRRESVLYPAELHIEEKIYFMVAYYFSNKWWERRAWAHITGFMLFDEQGNAVRDAQLFGKALLTADYDKSGVVGIQKRLEEIPYDARFAEKKYLPRMERLLRRTEQRWEEEGKLYVWQEISKAMPLLYEAVKDMLHWYEFEMKIAKALGYSFGHRAYYEDAIHGERVWRTYGMYMWQKYGKTILNLRKTVKEVMGEVRWNPWDRYVLKLFYDTLEMILSRCLVAPLHNGRPIDSQWLLYRARLLLAERVGVPIIGSESLPEKNPYALKLYHDEPFRESDEQDWEEREMLAELDAVMKED